MSRNKGKGRKKHHGNSDFDSMDIEVPAERVDRSSFASTLYANKEFVFVGFEDPCVKALSSVITRCGGKVVAQASNQVSDTWNKTS